MRVVVLHTEISEGAPEDEQDSLIQSQSVAAALEELGYQPEILPFSFTRLGEICSFLQNNPPAFVFNLVEETCGDMHLSYLPSLIFESLRIRFTGCPFSACSVTTNKLIAKRLLCAAQTNTPPWLSLNPIDEPHKDTSAIYLLKPVNADASLGIHEDSLELVPYGSEIYDRLAQHTESSGREWFAEAFIDGREFNVSLIEQDNAPLVLPPAEILFENYPEDKLRIVGYNAKWKEDSFEYQNTPRAFSFGAADRDLLDELRETALNCWHLFDLRGYARVDLRVDSQGHPSVLEVNANPCITPVSGFTAAAAAAGLSYKEMVRLISSAAIR
jgi:D-alanine-D-alanine ligase